MSQPVCESFHSILNEVIAPLSLLQPSTDVGVPEAATEGVVMTEMMKSSGLTYDSRCLDSD